MNSAKLGAQQGEQTQDEGMWKKCVEAIMATDVYREGQIGQERLDQKMRNNVGYVRRDFGPHNPSRTIRDAMNKRKAAQEEMERAKKKKGKNIVKTFTPPS